MNYSFFAEMHAHRQTICIRNRSSALSIAPESTLYMMSRGTVFFRLTVDSNNQLSQERMLLKFNRDKGRDGCLLWGNPSAFSESPENSIYIHELTDILVGKTTRALMHPDANPKKQGAFTLRHAATIHVCVQFMILGLSLVWCFIPPKSHLCLCSVLYDSFI